MKACRNPNKTPNNKKNVSKTPPIQSIKPLLYLYRMQRKAKRRIKNPPGKNRTDQNIFIRLSLYTRSRVIPASNRPVLGIACCPGTGASNHVPGNCRIPKNVRPRGSRPPTGQFVHRPAYKADDFLRGGYPSPRNRSPYGNPSGQNRSHALSAPSRCGPTSQQVLNRMHHGVGQIRGDIRFDKPQIIGSYIPIYPGKVQPRGLTHHGQS